MVGDTNRNIQVLNISNANAQHKTVLNDAKLLELIVKYPFLYNSRVRAFNDKDYTNWAWKNINAAFNRSYANDPNAAFATTELITRWHVLKPLIQCLSKAYDLAAIPDSLRNSVVKITTELNNPSSTVKIHPKNGYQQLLSQNMCAIAELPTEKRLALEREILDFILSTELESKQTTKLNDKIWTEIARDSDEFLNDIGFKQLLQISTNYRENIFYFNEPKSKRTLGWVPLKDKNKCTKPCKVRLKHINIEDYLPLAKIIQINKKGMAIK